MAASALLFGLVSGFRVSGADHFEQGDGACVSRVLFQNFEIKGLFSHRMTQRSEVKTVSSAS